MPRFKPVHQGLKLIPVDFDRQIQPGSFEYALCYLIDHELDLAAFHARYRNDTEGAPAYDPAAQVLTLCDRQGLIGREMFAIDGETDAAREARSLERLQPEKRRWNGQPAAP